MGTAAFIDALRRMAEGVPFASGYCSLALHSKAWPSNDVIRPLALRHPGIDIPDNDCACDLGTQIRGAYWLTLLGQPALLGLGKLPSDVKAELGPEITVHELANGVLLQAGERSEPGDVESGDVLPLIRRVAKYLEPIQLYQRVAVLFDDLALCNEWAEEALEVRLSNGYHLPFAVRIRAVPASEPLRIAIETLHEATEENREQLEAQVQIWLQCAMFGARSEHRALKPYLNLSFELLAILLRCLVQRFDGNAQWFSRHGAYTNGKEMASGIRLKVSLQVPPQPLILARAGCRKEQQPAGRVGWARGTWQPVE
ncbi:MAG: DUF3396 domain-containing protein [Polyangiaceae bacterium]